MLRPEEKKVWGTNKCQEYITGLTKIIILFSYYVYRIHTIVLLRERKCLGNELRSSYEGRRETNYLAVSTGRRSMLTLPSFIHSSLTSFCRSA